MAEPFKNFIDAAALRRLAAQLTAGTPDFDGPGFVAAAEPGLEALELKGRVRHIASVLRPRLPEAWPEALSVLLAGMGAPLSDTDAVSANFYLWPLVQVVEEHGLSHPEASLSALRAMTRRFTAEFAVRPYLQQHPDVAWPMVTAWTEDDDVHVRRLASEGSRPRLPWGRRLVGTTARGLAIIECLKDDPERYVQKSVANHVNDVSRDDPRAALALARRWSDGAPARRQWIVRHGLRSLIKAGDADALALVGFEPPQVTVSDLSISADTIPIGASFVVSATIAARTGSAQALMVDVIFDMQRKRGRSRKVFKAGQRTLAGGESWQWSHTLSLRPITTRRYYPGEHSVTLQINGRASGTIHFTLTAPE
ncbi:MAG: 3-methyladenine DNA glycosylase AlkC [Myxococcota bacterium]|jgi:3-methyladenine DNA glycosylase AlkC